MKTQNQNSVWAQGLMANKAYKEHISALSTVIDTMNALAHISGSDVSKWFDSIGLDRKPKNNKLKDGATYLTSELVYKYWACKDDEGNLCTLVKGEKRIVKTYSAFGVIKACYNLHKDAVMAERKANQKKAKEAKKVEATKEVKVAA